MTTHEMKGDNVNSEPKKTSRIGGGEGCWLMQLPPNIFNGIAGLLDSRSLLQLANSHDQLQKMVRESEKHWKDVFVSGHTFCIDYECYERLDANLLLDNAKIDNYKKNETVPDAPGFMELPTELVELILEPLDFGSLLQVEGCHEKLKAIGHRIPINFVSQQRDAFDISDKELEPIWKVESRPVPTFKSMLNDFAASGFLSELLDFLPEEQVEKEEEPLINVVPPIDYVMSNSLLDGRHVQTVRYEGVDPSRCGPLQSKSKPKFTCQNFFYLRDATDCYFDREILQDVLKPENVWSARLMDWIFELDLSKRSLRLGMQGPDELMRIRDLQAPRLSFESTDWEAGILRLMSGYIDEWMTGRRDIETVWIERFALENCWELAYYECELNLEAGLTALLNGLVEKYGWLSVHEENVVKGQLKRDDGKMLDIRVDADDIVMRTAGDSIRFLDLNTLYWDVPEF